MRRRTGDRTPDSSLARPNVASGFGLARVVVVRPASLTGSEASTRRPPTGLSETVGNKAQRRGVVEGMTLSDEPGIALETASRELVGLRDRDWGRDGAMMGLASTAGVSVPLGLLGGAALVQGLAPAWPFVLAGAVVMTVAAGFGAAFGRRWQRWLRQDSGTVPVKRWLGRLAVDGGVAAGLTGGAVGGLLGLSGGLVSAAFAGSVSAIIAAPAGAVLMVGLGMPAILSLVRGRTPWSALLGATVLGAPLVFASGAAIGTLVRLLGG